MSVLPLGDLGPSTQPSMSPDGRWAWDGEQWRPLFTPIEPKKPVSYVRLALLMLAVSFIGSLAAVYMWEIVVLGHLRGHFGIA